MKVIVETQKEELIKKLKPIIHAAKNYQGHFNATTLHSNADFVVMDNIHKKACLTILATVNKEFIIGSGSGHIWVAQHTATQITYSFSQNKLQVVPGEQIAINGIHDRLLLITDEK